MQLNKTETKILERTEKENMTMIHFESCESKREFNAALSLIKKGYLKELKREYSFHTISISRLFGRVGGSKTIHSTNLICEVIKTL